MIQGCGLLPLLCVRREDCTTFIISWEKVQIKIQSMDSIKCVLLCTLVMLKNLKSVMSGAIYVLCSGDPEVRHSKSTELCVWVPHGVSFEPDLNVLKTLFLLCKLFWSDF